MYAHLPDAFSADLNFLVPIEQSIEGLNCQLAPTLEFDLEAVVVFCSGAAGRWSGVLYEAKRVKISDGRFTLRWNAKAQPVLRVRARGPGGSTAINSYQLVGQRDSDTAGDEGADFSFLFGAGAVLVSVESQGPGEASSATFKNSFGLVVSVGMLFQPQSGREFLLLADYSRVKPLTAIDQDLEVKTQRAVVEFRDHFLSWRFAEPDLNLRPYFHLAWNLLDSPRPLSLTSFSTDRLLALKGGLGGEIFWRYNKLLLSSSVLVSHFLFSLRDDQLKSNFGVSLAAEASYQVASEIDVGLIVAQASERLSYESPAGNRSVSVKKSSVVGRLVCEF